MRNARVLFLVMTFCLIAGAREPQRKLRPKLMQQASVGADLEWAISSPRSSRPQRKAAPKTKPRKIANEPESDLEWLPEVSGRAANDLESLTELD